MSDENLFKVILLGEIMVGKTNLINILTGGKFNENETATSSSTSAMKDLLVKGDKYTIQIWDTIGQEKLRATNKIFMKNSKIVLLVYDITNEVSFKNLNIFYNEIIENIGRNDIVIAVVANKSDLYENQNVSKEKGEEYANQIGALFFETSALDHENIEKLFIEIVNHYDQNTNPNIDDPLRNSIKLKDKNNVNNNNQDENINDDNNNPKQNDKVESIKENKRKCC
jgi:small GTP-binding protein